MSRFEAAAVELRRDNVTRHLQGLLAFSAANESHHGTLRAAQKEF